MWAQIVGFVAMCIGIVAKQINKPRHILLCSIPASSLWAVQYMMLGAISGVIMNLIFVVQDGTIAFIKKRYLTYIILTFVTLTWSLGLYHSAHWYDVLPLIAGTIVNMALLYNRDNRPLYIRSIIINCVLWIVYNAIVGSWMGIGCAVMIISSSLISMARYEGWEVGRCYKSFMPSVARSLFVFPNFRTYP